jgi:hypothetical protein
VRVFVSIALITLVSASAALAGPDPRDLTAGGSPLSLENGRGTAIVRSREGSILGSVRRGRVRAVNGHVRGCETRRRLSRRTVLCIGNDLTFWATGRGWTITARGRGINASGVLKGSLTLQGTRGTYSLEPGGGNERPWPRLRRTYSIG